MFSPGNKQVYYDPPPAYQEIQPSSVDTPEYENRNQFPFNSHPRYNFPTGGNRLFIDRNINNEFDPFVRNTRNTNNDFIDDDRCCGDNNSFVKIFLIALIAIATTFFVIFRCSNFTIINDPPDPDDVTKVPRTFQLRWRSIFAADYTMVIESYDTDSDFSLSGFFGHNDTFGFVDDAVSGDFNTEPPISKTDDTIKYPIRALILDKFYDKGEYSVEEYFYKENQEDYYKRITTANAIFERNWPAEFLVTFTSKGNNNPKAIETCDYKLSFTKGLTGRILRKCSRAFETEFSVQAYVFGSIDYGLHFTENERGDTWYAFTTKPSWFFSYSRRDIFVHEGAPFPPIIPALYSVYYDFLSRKFDH